MSFFLSFLLFFLLISAFFLFFSLLLPWHLPSGGASQAGGAFRLPWLRSFLFYRTVIKGGTPPTPPRYVCGTPATSTLRGGCSDHQKECVAPNLPPGLLASALRLRFVAHHRRGHPTPLFVIRRGVLPLPPTGGGGRTPLLIPKSVVG